MKPTFNILHAVIINLIFLLITLSAFSTNKKIVFNNNGFYKASISKEKIYIHFDKTFYNQGESIWYKIYLVDAINHVPQTLSKVVYVELINPNHEIVESKTIEISDGVGKGDFKLSSESANGIYTIRAYTNFMRNFDDSYFFTKQIPVNTLNTNSSLESNLESSLISFTAEGGNLVSGFLNRIVAKATNSLGNGNMVTGDVFDDTNKKILNFKTSKLGLSSFQFIPQKGRAYTAIINHNGEKHTYPLPQVKNIGTTFRVDKTYHGYRVNVYSSLPNGVEGLKLIGKQKEKLVCHVKLKGHTPEMAIDLLKSNLKYGLVQFQLLNKNGAVLSEELAFIDDNNLEEKVMVALSKKVYNKDEEVEVNININQFLEEGVTANMSVSVTEVNPTEIDNYSLGIKSHLLLTPGMKSDIEKFNSHFDNDSIRKKTIHQLLIAQDNKQYSFKEDTNTNTLKFSPESGFKLSGVVKRKNNQKPAKVNVVLSYRNDEGLGYDQTITDSLGRFSFNNLKFENRTFIALKAKKLSSEKYGNKFIIELDSFMPPQYNYAKDKSKINLNTEFAPQKGEIKLDQVKVAAEKKRSDRFTKKRKASLYAGASHTLDFRDLRASPSAPNVIEALRGMLPGIHIVGNNITLRGKNSLTGSNLPLFLLDGLPTDLDMILSIPIFDIDFIDIVQATRATVYGVRGGGGIVAVYTLDGTEDDDELKDRSNTISFYHPGYYQARTFNQKDNNSSTLYWNPDLKLNQSNRTKITFKTANKSATYKILLEGITSNGIAFKKEAFFEVE